MSLTALTLTHAEADILASDALPASKEEALAVIVRLRAELAATKAQLRQSAWASGRRADGAIVVPGLSDRHVCALRVLAATGHIKHGDHFDLHRTISGLRADLRKIAPSIEITTRIGFGYELTAGFDDANRLLLIGAKPPITILDFTPEQTDMLRRLSRHGSIHIEQGKAVQRHMSNIRAKLKRHGFASKIEIETHPGEGLYTVSARGRKHLAKLLTGEMIPYPRPKPKAHTPQQRKQEPALMAA